MRRLEGGTPMAADDRDTARPAQREFEVKDYLLVAPVLGTSLAVAYDVGFFFGLDINYFTVFGLSEHIVFALQATPIAISFLALAYGQLWVMKWWGPPPRKGARFILLVILVAMMSASMYHYLRSGLVGPALMTFVAGAVLLPPVPEPWRPAGRVISGAILIVCFSFFFGEWRGREAAKAGTSLHTIQYGENQEVCGRMIGSGERGILFFDAGSGQLALLPWSTVKRIVRTN